MARWHCIEAARRGQRGNALIEALIAMLLLAFIGIGLLYASSRTAIGQRTANVANLTVGELRYRLQSDGIATGCPAEGKSQTSMAVEVAPGVSLDEVTRNCTVQASLVTVNGVSKSVKVPHMEIEVSDAKLLGSSTDALVLRN